MTSTINDPVSALGMCDILIEGGKSIDIAAIERSIINDDSLLPIVSQSANVVSDYTQGLNGLLDFNIPDTSESLDVPLTISSIDTVSAPAKPQPDQLWQASSPDDAYLAHMTNEERKQTHINNVLDNGSAAAIDDQFIEQEDEETELAKMIEQIYRLRDHLKNDGVNIERIPEVNVNSSKKEIRCALKILQIKNDKSRYCDMFEEAILAGAYGLEAMFNGKNEWFGSKIDLVGYSDTVKVKLRRMRYDTSSFVSSVMQGYAIGHGWRIILELLPSLFLYSRDRRLRTNDNLVSDTSYKDAIQNLGV